jgi:hypothetical protein
MASIVLCQRWPWESDRTEIPMPTLLIDGKFTDGRTEDRVARPCEWCGRHLTEGQNRLVWASWWGERPEGVDRIAVLVRLCDGCFDIYSNLGRDGVKEI